MCLLVQCYYQCSKVICKIVSKPIYFSWILITGNIMMINTSTTPPIISFLPVIRPLNPGHDVQETRDPPILDLCVRKRPTSPDYPHDYTSMKYPPSIILDPQQITRPRSHSVLSESSEVTSSEIKDINANCPITKIKPNRPFKAYPKDPFSIALIGTTSDLLGKDSTEAYTEFRQKMLSYVQAGQNGTNKNMRRTQGQSPQQITDPTYWEKRKKNNEAAKRSRDARRAKEDEIAIRCAFLEQENIKLRFRIAALESEKERLQNMVYH